MFYASSGIWEVTSISPTFEPYFKGATSSDCNNCYNMDLTFDDDSYRYFFAKDSSNRWPYHRDSGLLVAESGTFGIRPCGMMESIFGSYTSPNPLLASGIYSSLDLDLSSGARLFGLYDAFNGDIFPSSGIFLTGVRVIDVQINDNILTYINHNGTTSTNLSTVPVDSPELVLTAFSLSPNKTLTTYINNFDKVYDPGQNYPDSFPSGVPSRYGNFSVSRLSIDGLDFYERWHGSLASGIFPVLDNSCLGPSGIKNELFDFISGLRPATSGASIYSGGSNSFHVNPFNLQKSGDGTISLDNYILQKLGCKTCGEQHTAETFDKWFNQDPPILKLHYLASGNYRWFARFDSISSSGTGPDFCDTFFVAGVNGNLTLLDGGVISDGGSVIGDDFTTCLPSPGDSSPNFNQGWKTSILNKVSDILYEGPEETIEVFASGNYMASGTYYCNSTGSCPALFTDIAAGPFTSTFSASVNPSASVKFRCYAEFQGDTRWHFYIKKTGGDYILTSNTFLGCEYSSGVFHLGSTKTGYYNAFPARKVIGLNETFTARGSMASVTASATSITGAGGYTLEDPNNPGNFVAINGYCSSAGISSVPGSGLLDFNFGPFLMEFDWRP